MSERANEVARKIYANLHIFKSEENVVAIIESLLETLPEFNPPVPHPVEWTKCSEKMPEVGSHVFWFDGYRVHCDGHVNTQGTIREMYTHWMPRFIPAPPVEEESPCIRDLMALPVNTKAGRLVTLDDVLEIVKRHEGAKK